VAVRTAVLATFYGTAEPSVPVTLGVVPEGHTWLVREVVVQHNTVDASLLVLMVRRGGVDFLVYRAAQEFQVPVTLAQRHTVLGPGDMLRCRVDGPGSGLLRAYVSGSDLLGVA
jgi:hypothetical protein